MKRKTMQFSAMLAMIIATVWIVNPNQEPGISKMALENIEAITQSEGSAVKIPCVQTKEKVECVFEFVNAAGEKGTITIPYHKDKRE